MSNATAALQDWAIGIDRRLGSLKILGVLLVLVLLGCIGMVFALFGGAFTKYDGLTVLLPANSTAVLPGSSVQYRDVSVGKVVGAAKPQSDGSALVDVHIEPGKLKSIPASVRASVTPISVFGNQYVVLEVPTGDTSTVALRAGSRVEARTGAAAISVQQTVSSLDRLLVELHPAELNAALTAVAQALQGQGQQLGETGRIASEYLAALQPLWPTVVENLGLLAPVADQIAASSPDIIGILGNQLTTARTINQEPDLVHRLIVGSGAFADQAEQLNTDIERPFSLLAAASGPFLEAISANPNTISQLLEGLDEFSKAVVQAGKAGPFLSVNATVDVKNPANLAAAALGGTQAELIANLTAGLGAGLVNPPTYGAGNRPSYTYRPSDAASTAGAPAAALPGPTVPALAPDAERAAVQTIATAIGGSSPRSADAAALLLSPLLVSLGQQ